MPLRWMIVIFSWVLLFSAGSACADTRYVVDQLVITLRAGMGNQYKVITTLKTDASMEVLSDQDNYLYVRLADGTEGYVLQQYVTKKSPRSLIIKQLRNKAQILTDELAHQTELANGATSEVESLSQKLDQTIKKSTNNEELLATSQAAFNDLQVKAENVVIIDTERLNLKQQLGEANAELDLLRQDNDAMLKTAMIKWFVAGGGVMFFGWVAGKFSRKKKRSLGNF